MAGIGIYRKPMTFDRCLLIFHQNILLFWWILWWFKPTFWMFFLFKTRANVVCPCGKTKWIDGYYCDLLSKNNMFLATNIWRRRNFFISFDDFYVFRFIFEAFTSISGDSFYAEGMCKISRTNQISPPQRRELSGTYSILNLKNLWLS